MALAFLDGECDKVLGFRWTQGVMQIGYARTSTVEQEAGLEGQLRDLQAAGCEEVFSERVSSVAKREKLAEALRFARKGDVLVVSKPDRLARSVADLLTIVGTLEAKGVALRVLSMGGSEVDTRNPTGKLMLTMLGAFAEFERALMLERQREGIAKAKDAGKFKGRAPTARRLAGTIAQLHREGVKPTEIAQRLGVSRSSVFAMLKEGREAA